MKFVGSYVFLLVLLFYSWQSFAWDKRHMVAGDVNAEAGVDDNDRLIFSLGGSYGHLVSQKIQIVQELSYAKSEQIHALNISTGITYNLSSEINKSIFLSGLIGLDYSKWRLSSYSNSDGLYSLRLGKRFALAENISWNVFVEYQKYFESYPAYNPWTFHLFNMSVYF
ncbi:MAG: hypothetical protein A2202_01115 [Bdellovibrionales bacterium RIFOXYA1_FULL_36_14]|nr:MAG: hypothetical protein A2202_01115 [Bdellovibrionales bacterium RIFOXYA1_FULL_36_14]